MSTNCGFLSIGVERAQEHRWVFFAASYIVQATAVTALLLYTVLAPTVFPTLVEHIEWVAPEPDSAAKTAHVKTKSRPLVRMAPEPIARMQPKLAVPQNVVSVLQVQQSRVRRFEEVAEVAQPHLSIALPKLDSKVLNLPKASGRIIATNTFGENTAKPTLPKAAPIDVQTGGFGDSNGGATNARGSNRPIIAATGSFDLPASGGHGNGSGGSTGARGTLASTGFGNGMAVSSATRVAGQGHIQSTNFVTMTAASDEGHHSKAGSHQAISVPVSIQSKPTPVYSSEARQLKIEGEVLLRVVFTAEGQIRILNVVHGLGHGLDEAAQRAAQGVRFSPAMRDGHPIDSNATLHIVFQLS